MPLVCNAGGEKGLSNNIKANEYRMRVYATYTTLDICVQTMFVHVSQEYGETVQKEWVDKTIDCQE